MGNYYLVVYGMPDGTTVVKSGFGNSEQDITMQFKNPKYGYPVDAKLLRVEERMVKVGCVEPLTDGAKKYGRGNAHNVRYRFLETGVVYASFENPGANREFVIKGDFSEEAIAAASAEAQATGDDTDAHIGKATIHCYDFDKDQILATKVILLEGLDEPHAIDRLSSEVVKFDGELDLKQGMQALPARTM